MSAEKPLAGKAALITGASRGIGLAIARRLGSLGARMAICARDAAKLEQAAEVLRGEGIVSGRSRGFPLAPPQADGAVLQASAPSASESF